MTDEMSTWIDSYRRMYGWPSSLTGERSVTGLCKDASEAMIKAFPQLTLCYGVAWCEYSQFGEPDGRIARIDHWWTKLPDGEIVDPTASQFEPYGKVVIYEETSLVTIPGWFSSEVIKAVGLAYDHTVIDDPTVSSQTGDGK